jgi:predicted nuclease of restriction endonuclease-like (RecB) superfamily
MSPRRPWSSFDTLVRGIGEIDQAAVLAVGRQAQQLLSLRSWLVGTWIVQFQQGGEDRAAYGERLLPRLSEALQASGRRGMSPRNLANFRLVALAYPTLDPRELVAMALPELADDEILQTPANSTGRDLPWRDAPWLRRLFSELTFTHLVELARIDDPTERAFYELHSLRERWAVRELIRQRNTLLYQRVGLSTERDAVLALAREGKIDERPSALIRDPLVLEFLGLGSGGALDESQLEDAMLAHLQQFLAELGREFCFVGRQVRITIGNRHHHLDLLFFHRRLRCLVAIELKTGEFEPAHYGQMSFYLNYLAAEETLEGENPPIGILLCSSKDEESVHYTVPPNASVVVARYLLELPKEEQLKQWLHEARVATELQILQSPAKSMADDAD